VSAVKRQIPSKGIGVNVLLVDEHAPLHDGTAIDAIASLSDGLRRRLYEFARAARRPVSRDEAASAVGISRKLAAFHLDRLAEVGLLRFRFKEPHAARGRPPKIYVASDVGVELSIPARRHELLAEILAGALLLEDRHGSARAASTRVAHARGVAAAAETRNRMRRGRVGAERGMTFAEEVLTGCGFEPYRTGSGCVRLRNCPFHPLAAAMPELVCSLNHAFVSGVVAGLGVETVHAVLAPSAGECCVELRLGAQPADDLTPSAG
jgi:predicted ArsR family transcriptional regulator